jgi:hypothetical protein
MNPLVSFDDLSQSQINLIFSLPKRFSPKILFEISCGLLNRQYMYRYVIGKYIIYPYEL